MVPERFARMELMVGAEGIARLRGSFVVVVGLGAVGSYCVEALARAGVGRLRLVDHDTVHASNLNRQLYALEATLGAPKAMLAAERVLAIDSECRVEPVTQYCDASTLPGLLDGSPDLVCDCIDSFAAKVELLSEARRRGLPLVSSMGAALRTDPTQIRVGTLGSATMGVRPDRGEHGAGDAAGQVANAPDGPSRAAQPLHSEPRQPWIALALAIASGIAPVQLADRQRRLARAERPVQAPAHHVADQVGRARQLQGQVVDQPCALLPGPKSLQREGLRVVPTRDEQHLGLTPRDRGRMLVELGQEIGKHRGKVGHCLF
ncbi:MAG: ThiF family adenylyltransferase [Armatimonadetes bacterium]|nr:ThiF family adenylyltransferase [Armatimonadota bacterium]